MQDMGGESKTVKQAFFNCRYAKFKAETFGVWQNSPFVFDF